MTSSSPAVSRHHPHLKYLNYKELGALYWSVFIKGIGESLISIFTAIYLLTIGLPLPSVAIFYIIYFAVIALMGHFSLHLGHTWGIKKTLGLGVGFIIVYYFLLTSITAGLPYQLVALWYGTGASLYFSAFHLDLALTLRTRSAGRSLSKIQILTILAGIIGPIVGALFIVNLSFTFLFMLVAAILAASLIPLFRRGDYRMPGPMPTQVQALRHGGPRRTWMYLLFGFAEAATDILWPVFLYLHYPNLLAVGGIISITAILLLVGLAISGRSADRNQQGTYKAGVAIHAPSWIARLLWLTPGGLLLGNFLSALSISMIKITVDQSMYREAKDEATSTTALLFRTYAAAPGRLIALLLAVAIPNLALVFLIVAIVTLFQLAVAPKHTSANLDR